MFLTALLTFLLAFILAISALILGSVLLWWLGYALDHFFLRRRLGPHQESPAEILRQHLARPSTEQDDAYSGLWPDGAGIERGRGRGDDSALEDVEAASRARTGERQERLDPLVGLVGPLAAGEGQGLLGPLLGDELRLGATHPVWQPPAPPAPATNALVAEGAAIAAEAKEAAGGGAGGAGVAEAVGGAAEGSGEAVGRAAAPARGAAVPAADKGRVKSSGTKAGGQERRLEQGAEEEDGRGRVSQGGKGGEGVGSGWQSEAGKSEAGAGVKSRDERGERQGGVPGETYTMAGFRGGMGRLLEQHDGGSGHGGGLHGDGGSSPHGHGQGPGGLASVEDAVQLEVEDIPAQSTARMPPEVVHGFQLPEQRPSAAAATPPFQPWQRHLPPHAPQEPPDATAVTTPLSSPLPLTPVSSYTEQQHPARATPAPQGPLSPVALSLPSSALPSSQHLAQQPRLGPWPAPQAHSQRQQPYDPLGIPFELIEHLHMPNPPCVPPPPPAQRLQAPLQAASCPQHTAASATTTAAAAAAAPAGAAVAAPAASQPELSLHPAEAAEGEEAGMTEQEGGPGAEKMVTEGSFRAPFLIQISKGLKGWRRWASDSPPVVGHAGAAPAQARGLPPPVLAAPKEGAVAQVQDQDTPAMAQGQDTVGLAQVQGTAEAAQAQGQDTAEVPAAKQGTAEAGHAQATAGASGERGRENAPSRGGWPKEGAPAGLPGVGRAALAEGVQEATGAPGGPSAWHLQHNSSGTGFEQQEAQQERSPAVQPWHPEHQHSVARYAARANHRQTPDSGHSAAQAEAPQVLGATKLRPCTERLMSPDASVFERTSRAEAERGRESGPELTRESSAGMHRPHRPEPFARPSHPLLALHNEPRQGSQAPRYHRHHHHHHHHSHIPPQLLLQLPQPRVEQARFGWGEEGHHPGQAERSRPSSESMGF